MGRPRQRQETDQHAGCTGPQTPGRRPKMSGIRSPGVTRRGVLSSVAALPVLARALAPASAPAELATSRGLLPSGNDGPAKQAIFDFVRATIDRSSPSYVFPEERIAVFDQDGTL